MTVYSIVNTTAGQNSVLLPIAVKFLGKLRPLSPPSSVQLPADIRTTRSSGATKKTAT